MARQLIAMACAEISDVVNRGTGIQNGSIMISFLIYAAVYLALTWWLFRTADADALAARAQRRRSPLRRFLLRWFPLLMALQVGVFAIWAVTAASPWAGSAAARARNEGYPLGVLVVLCGLTVAAGWTLAHVAYAHHYAMRYYGGGGSGLSFPGDERPNYVDFAYLSFAVGTTFGTTDVELTQRRFRQVMLGHQLFSFTFNTVIVAFLVTFLTSTA